MSSIWNPDILPPKQGHLIELRSADYVSGPCWERLNNVAVSKNIHELVWSGLEEWWELGSGSMEIFQFYFADNETAKEWALIVQKSAMNLRKNRRRLKRMKEAGGFYDKSIIQDIFNIQQGRCYYSGDHLTQSPKNYSIDHIQPIVLGGSNWPINLALSITEVNRWKGGHHTARETLEWLAQSRDKHWLIKQIEFCREVDSKREVIDVNFKISKSQ